jgi:hypothetical protein
VYVIVWTRKGCSHPGGICHREGEISRVGIRPIEFPDRKDALAHAAQRARENTNNTYEVYPKHVLVWDGTWDVLGF